MNTILQESLNLRKSFNTVKKAISHAQQVLPKEPPTMVKKYLNGKQPQPKSETVARRHSRFTQPALPEIDEIKCDCSGKCFTKRCPCKDGKNKCTATCRCKKDVCKNV